jgi:hypothetical protein
MRLFHDPVGGGSLWFDNLATADGTAVAYDPQARSFVRSPPYCVNRDVIGCNWIAPSHGMFCRSCAMTAQAPDLSVPGALPNWAATEASKRWVIDNLGRWCWFRPEDSGTRPVFNMLAEGAVPVLMGHAQGVVTISVAEADPVLRVTRREALQEPYRTMVGHMRHEMAHMIWWRLSLRDDFLTAFRDTFGDERADYAEALQRHYRDGPSVSWRDGYLTSYASAHPHEDWAETVAHLLHLTDLADSFSAANLDAPDLPMPGWDAYAEPNPDRLVQVAAGLAVALNHVNRSMGLPDLYPFILSAGARRKLSFAHHWLTHGAQTA